MTDTYKTCKRCGKIFDGLSFETECYQCNSEIHLERIQKAIETAEPDETVDTWSNDYVVCPYCGSAIDARHTGYCDFPEAYEEDEHEIHCDECDHDYILRTFVSYSWETEKIKDGS